MGCDDIKCSWVVKIKSFQNSEIINSALISVYVYPIHWADLKNSSISYHSFSNWKYMFFFMPPRNTDLQPLNHIIPTAHHATKKAPEFFYSMPTVLVRYRYHSDSYLSIVDDVIMNVLYWKIDYPKNIFAVKKVRTRKCKLLNDLKMWYHCEAKKKSYTS